MANIKVDKIYLIDFIEYTDCLKDTVSDGNDILGEIDYISLGKQSVLIREKDFDKFKKYGGGFKSAVFVGNLITII